MERRNFLSGMLAAVAGLGLAGKAENAVAAETTLPKHQRWWIWRATPALPFLDETTDKPTVEQLRKSYGAGRYKIAVFDRDRDEILKDSYEILTVAGPGDILIEDAWTVR